MDIAVDEVPLEGSLVAAGVDSLAALGLCNKIKSRFHVPFELASVLSGKSISELSAEVLRGLKAHKGRASQFHHSHVTIREKPPPGNFYLAEVATGVCVWMN